MENENENKGIKFSTMHFSVGKDIPQYSENISSANDYVSFGDDNNMPDYYIELIDRSPKHNAIIHQKAAMISGNGFNKNNLTDDALKFLHNIMNVDDMDEIVSKCGYDLEVYGAFVLNLVWNKDRTKIAEVNYINPQSVRIAKPNPIDPTSENYYISRDWGNINKKENKPVKYNGFSTRNREDANQILYCKLYQAGKYFYGVPGYISGARWIEMEYEISQWHLSNIRNGFAPSMFINFPTGVPTDEEMTINDRRLMNQLAGPMGGGKAFITYSDDKDSAPVITPIETNSNDSKYIEVNELITEGILSSHRVNDAALFGLKGKESGVFVGQTEILNSLELFRAQYVVPRQIFIEKVFNRIARLNGIPDKLELKSYELNFTKMDVSIGDILSILTSTLNDEVKKNMLILNGYTEEDANKLIITNTSVDVNGVPATEMEAAPVNESLKNLTGRQRQGLDSIVRKYKKGDYTMEQALIHIKAFGFNDEEAKSYLGIMSDEIDKEKIN